MSQLKIKKSLYVEKKIKSILKLKIFFFIFYTKYITNQINSLFNNKTMLIKISPITLNSNLKHTIFKFFNVFSGNIGLLYFNDSQLINFQQNKFSFLFLKLNNNKYLALQLKKMKSLCFFFNIFTFVLTLKKLLLIFFSKFRNNVI